MRLNVDFSLLENAARKMMGPTPVSVEIDVRRGLDRLPPIDIALRSGIEIDDLNLIKSDPVSGVLSYEGRQVVLYIQDQFWRIRDVIRDGSLGTKVHVAECGTLSGMRRQGRFERYVATTDVSGKFLVTGKSYYGELAQGRARLKVCKVCLSKLNYRGYNRDRARVFREFRWRELFEEYSPRFAHMPTRRAGAPEVAGARSKARSASRGVGTAQARSSRGSLKPERRGRASWGPGQGHAARADLGGRERPARGNWNSGSAESRIPPSPLEELSDMQLAEVVGAGENDRVEFKSTLRRNLYTQKRDDKIEHAVLKTLAAFLNTRGGTLVIGVADDGTALGIGEDGVPNTDKMMLHLNNLVEARLGAGRFPLIRPYVRRYGGQEVLVVLCEASEEGVWLKDKDGKRERFFLRTASATNELPGSEAMRYIEERRRTGRKVT